MSGPTASGKTSLSVALAKHFNTAIISADSRQFYKELSIGTAKPSKEEMEGVKHYMINSHFLKDEVSAADFEKQGLEILEHSFQDKDHMILVGGSGMFIDALCEGLDDIPASKNLRDELIEFHRLNGLSPLLNELKESDPIYFEQVDKDNPVRIIRALEAIRLSGSPYSTLRKASKKTRSFNVIRFVLNHEREVLYDRINRRVDLMMEQGLLEEVKSALPYRNLTSMNTVGYKEFFPYFDNKISLEESIAAVKQNSRRYAKRQITWFKRNKEAHWINYREQKEMVLEIVKKIAKQQKLE
ncbi:MAG: tRNA (adenosine(37)-N6)-dimethylallyltransferase MiaA [Crocinitomicaceae bacterium]|nr:tRNA (adenosine(37)-N6)-dimethylallyltransferase MiaA [Crocinitomicaceae bacterium]